MVTIINVHLGIYKPIKHNCEAYDSAVIHTEPLWHTYMHVPADNCWYPFILREWTPVPLFKSDLFVLSAVSSLNILWLLIGWPFGEENHEQICESDGRTPINLVQRLIDHVD